MARPPINPRRPTRMSCRTKTIGSTRKGPSTFGSLNVPVARPPEREMVAEPRDVEIADEGEEAGAPGREQISPLQRCEAGFGVVRHGGGEHDGGDHHVEGHGDEPDRVGIVHPGDQRDRATEIEAEQQQRQRKQGARQADAGECEDQQDQQECDFIGRRLDDRDPAGSGQQPERPALQRRMGQAQAGAFAEP